MKLQIRSKPWKKKKPPSKILVLRFQALGDTIITLPYLQSLKNNYPAIKLHFYTRKEVSEIPQALDLFEKVIAIGGGRNAKLQFILSLFLLPKLWWHNYDAVLDLQNHKISRAIRYLLFPKAWSEFDKYSPQSAGVRTQQTIDALGLKNISTSSSFQFKEDLPIDQLLKENGWDGMSQLVVLNPAGNLPSRNWPVENYIGYAKAWLNRKSQSVQFVITLLHHHEEKGARIKSELRDHCINLSGKTSVPEAFRIIKKSSFVITEDSGLMHMAWVQSIPTLALFGSSRKDWSAPQGEFSICLDASDLECGPCMLAECFFKDNRCLTRYSPEFILDQSTQLLAKVNQ